MSIFKQGAVALVILAVAAAGWLRLSPNSTETLAQYNLDYPFLIALAAPEGGAETEGDAASSMPRGFNPNAAQSVVVETAGTAEVNDRLNAIGNGKALSSVRVMPYGGGIIDEIRVDSGDRVAAGDVIVTLDSREEIIAVEKARLALADAQTTLQRRETLRSASPSAISNVEVAEAELAVQGARLDLNEAELALDRRSIEAPSNGIIGIVPVTVGDRVTTETEIVIIDDRSEILVDFWVAEQFAGQIEVGQPVTAVPVSNPASRFEGEVSAVDNQVDEASRTLRVRASVPNEEDRLRPGMSFSVTMSFDGQTYPTVHPLAVQWSAEGAYVWRVDEDKAKRVPVNIVQRNSDSVLVDAEIASGDLIVTEGLMQLRDGSAVALVDGPETTSDEPLAEVQREQDAALARAAPARRGS